MHVTSRCQGLFPPHPFFKGKALGTRLVTSNTLWASVNFLGQITIQSYFVFVSTVELRTLYMYPGTSLYEHILWVHLEKNWTYARTFPVQRKEINVVKVRFTMMYFSRKLNNKKIIATACNLWRQITCSFQVYHTGLWPHKPPWFPGAKSTRKTPWKTLFWISRFFFHLTNIDVTSCFYRQFFRLLYEDKGQKITIFNCEYLEDACFNWAETS